ncbi:MAG: ABC transporter permease, partial [Kangiellaceae bacterium]|nr:ABC transporter permease [Kangiellaceae bacterium]
FAEGVNLVELSTAFGLFIFSAILLGMIFISLSYLISSWVSEKSKAAGLALIIWFFFVLIFDMALLGILVATEGQVHSELFPYLLLLNPTDVFRLVNLVNFETNGTGLLSIASEQSFSLSGLMLSMTIWIIVPFALAYYRLTKRPI